MDPGFDPRVGQNPDFMKVAGQLPASYMQNPHNLMHQLIGGGSGSAPIQMPVEQEKSRRPGRAFGWTLPDGASGHEDGDEGQQENQHATGHRQHDGHQGNDGLHHVMGLVAVAVVFVVGHGFSRVFDKYQQDFKGSGWLGVGQGLLTYPDYSRA
jgi:hypothetical protein